MGKKKKFRELSDEEKNKIIKKENKKVIFNFLILIICLLSALILNNKLEDKNIKLANEKERQEKLFSEIKASYNKFVSLNEDALIYKLENDKYVEAGSISKDTKLELEDKDIKDYNDIYFKLKNLDYYVKYSSVEKIDEFKIDYTYKNYIPFNIDVITNENAILYSDEGNVYNISEELKLPIIIKDIDKYYVEYDNRLLYVKKDEIKNIVEANNHNEVLATSIATILYHYVYGEGEKNICIDIICHSLDQVSSHFKYLNENNYYTLKMKDMDLWIDGKIQLPKNSVLVTVDDGWYIDGMKMLLEEYKVNATLFLITSLIPVEAARTEYFEIHSHTHNLHKVGVCPGGQGSPLKCLDRDTILNDLKQSREIAYNTTYFAYPLYEYNSYTISLLQEAGFTMAFKGGMYKVKQGVNKFEVPRITIHRNTTLQQFINYIS